jgi:hypothetical protein
MHLDDLSPKTPSFSHLKVSRKPFLIASVSRAYLRSKEFTGFKATSLELTGGGIMNDEAFSSSEWVGMGVTTQ